ncbi:MAG: S8 family serine peptidase [Ginsengibacter sp.]
MQKIDIDESDLPINPFYISQLRITPTVSILNQSKWLNQVCIETNDSNALTKIQQLLFVKEVKPVNGANSTFSNIKNKFIVEKINPEATSFNKEIRDISYGKSAAQIQIHEGEFLHNKGFNGKGMLIAIIDAGFYHYQTLPAFDSLREGNRIIDTYDFVNNKISVNEEDSHGMYCFSIIASNMPGMLVGSGTGAAFLLYKSEDVESEFPIEEQNWLAAAERSDSAGADIISTSLGYTTFDNPAFNYAYKDMNGETTMITRGANMAAKKGMIVVVAAGNDGQTSWHYISAPADGKGILSVGAVTSTGIPAPFSSYGPSFDGRVKPDVASVGAGTAISSTSGEVTFGSGTSFATPNIAGLTACLWQAFPEFTNSEIIETILKSSSKYNSPDVKIGYGIPDFRIAFELLTRIRIFKNAELILGENDFKAYPNPFHDQFTILIKPKSTERAQLLLYDISGKLVSSKMIETTAGQIQLITYDNLPILNPGIYLLKYATSGKTKSIKLVLN